MVRVLPLLTLITLLLLSSPVLSLKFLAYSAQLANSHVNFMGKITDALVDAGHEVVMVSPIVDTVVGSPGTKKARVIELPQCEEAKDVEKWMNSPGGVVDTVWTADDPFALFVAFERMFDAWIAQCNATIHHPGLIEQLKAEKFDAAYSEAMDMCGFGLFRILGIDKYAVTQSLSHIDEYFVTHVPSMPSYVPTLMSTFGDRMSYSQRSLNLLFFANNEYYVRKMSPRVQSPFIEYDQHFPKLEEIIANASLVFRNSEPLVDFPTLSAFRIVDIGGIVVSSKHEKLNQTWSSVLDLRPQTVLLSFGTFAKAYLMPEEYKKTIRNTLLKFPNITFIWKYEKPEHGISEGIPNLIETTWMPQTDLLSDPRLSLFITHCGQGSTMEANTAGVPLLVIPVAADQFRNAQQVVRNEIGIMIDKTELSSEGPLERALTEMLSNTKYRENAQRIASTIADRPIPVRKLFVRNMEFLARHGPLRQLDHYGRQLNFFQYYSIDVIAAVLTVAFVVSYLIFAVLRACFYFLRKIVVVKRKTD